MANSRVGTSSGSATPTGVIRTVAVAAANAVTGGAAGAVDAAVTETGKALTPFWEKVQEATAAANAARNNQMVSTATQPPPTQPPNQAWMAALGPLAGLIPSLASAFGGSGSNSNNSGGSNRNRPNTQDIAQNTPRNNKETKEDKTKDPKIKENSTTPNLNNPTTDQSLPGTQNQRPVVQSSLLTTDNIT